MKVLWMTTVRKLDAAMLLLSEQAASTVDVKQGLSFSSVCACLAQVYIQINSKKLELYHRYQQQNPTDFEKNLNKAHPLNFTSLTLMMRKAPITGLKLCLHGCLWKGNKTCSTHFRERFKSRFRDCELHTEYHKGVR